MQTIRVIDSHTGGEPTRLVLEGGPDLGAGPLSGRVQRFRERFDDYRCAIVNEPRGSDPLVGALLVEPHREDCQFGVIYFNNVGYLGMCGHGTIGMIASLHFAGRIRPGVVRIDTPVGAVEARLHEDDRIGVSNVASYRATKRLAVPVAGIGEVVGDVAWGGNWFFLISEHDQIVDLKHVGRLTDYASRVLAALRLEGHARVDHVELFAPATAGRAHSRNFVLCPGNAYDRSPCGTGTSAKLACLAADGKLAAGAPYVQESVIGGRFTASYQPGPDGAVLPRISGRA